MPCLGSCSSSSRGASRAAPLLCTPSVTDDSHPAPRFVEVRMVEAKPGIAFVEFESELQSGVALSGLAGFQITPTHTMQVTFAKQ